MAVFKRITGRPGRGEQAGSGFPEGSTPTFKEGDIVSVSTTAWEHGIHFRDRGRLQEALLLYGSGEIISSVPPEVTDGYPLRRNKAPMPKAFIRYMLDDADSRVAEGLPYTKRFDYDAVGPFHKSTIEIYPAPKGSRGYVLELFVGGAGNIAEKDIAEALGQQRAILKTEATVAFAPKGDKFEIDMDAVSATVARALNSEDDTKKRRGRRGTIVVSGSAIADHFMSRNQWGDPETHEIEIARKDGYAILLKLENVGKHSDEYGPDRRELWTREGNALSGGLYSWGSKTEPENPTIRFFVEDKSSKSIVGRNHVVDPKKQAQMRKMVEDLATAFRA